MRPSLVARPRLDGILTPVTTPIGLNVDGHTHHLEIEHPDSLLDALPPQPNGKEAARNNIVREMVETERKFVQDLEIMQVRVFVPPYVIGISRLLRRLHPEIL